MSKFARLKKGDTGLGIQVLESSRQHWQRTGRENVHKVKNLTASSSSRPCEWVRLVQGEPRRAGNARPRSPKNTDD